MKISVNDKELFTISENKRRVICDYLHEDIFEEDMKRRVKWVIDEIYNAAARQLISTWSEKISGRVENIPSDNEKYCDLIISQPDYKSRKQRDLESLQK